MKTVRLIALFLALTVVGAVRANSLPELGPPKYSYKLADHPAPAGAVSLGFIGGVSTKVDSAGGALLILPFQDSSFPVPTTIATRVVWLSPSGRIRYSNEETGSTFVTLISLSPGRVVLLIYTAGGPILRTLRPNSLGVVKATDVTVPSGFGPTPIEFPPSKGFILTNIGAPLNTVEFRYYR